MAIAAECNRVVSMPTRGVERRLQGLDALRGLAILLVLIRHSWPELAGTAGAVGVVVFFTLSGYLITGLLTRDIQTYGRVRYARFYRNRALRLLPALFLLLAGIAVVTLTLDPLDERGSLPRAVTVGLTYTANLPFNHGSPTVEHLWTLATEEQFYIVWPVILAIGIRFRKLRLAVFGSALLIVAALGVSLLLTYPGVSGIYSLPTSWCIAMVIGACAFLAREKLQPHLQPPRLRAHAAAVAALAVVLGTAVLPEDKGSPVLYIIVGPTIALSSVVLIVYLTRWQTLPTPALTPLRWLGVVSYAAYLWNWPIVVWIDERPLSAVQALGAVVLTLVAATISWWLVERPALLLKSRLDAHTKVKPLSTERDHADSSSKTAPDAASWPPRSP
jgi:peptidoglycan/LPS O-acetylase OafA/YrhL